ncbi:hypothetical protein HBA55_09075 [Pseudomaricurvus alkylphenolicus]|uniref:hypothetical protein n=1 Tax=Pseudomaricurvus alkylphenolicus TaxID=1306991 RepID=UPI0014238949|nr:hypothetical protein [Pseudomaricurvus alkylphenolicus]NIB39734.1 hypothetical protein [Pseudomaricurvus alkylphenolicus]
MKLLLTALISIALGLSSMAMANESDSPEQEPVAKQVEQQKKFKHDHRKHKGLPSAGESAATDNDEAAEKPKKKKVHNHKKVHK